MAARQPITGFNPPTAEDETQLLHALVQYLGMRRGQKKHCSPWLDGLAARVSLRLTQGQESPPVEVASVGSEPGGMDAALVTYPKAAAVLGVSLSTVKRRVKAGDLQPVRVSPRTVRLRRADIDNLILNGGL